MLLSPRLQQPLRSLQHHKASGSRKDPSLAIRGLQGNKRQFIPSA